LIIKLILTTILYSYGGETKEVYTSSEKTRIAIIAKYRRNKAK
jgi:hypothetical protein